MRQATTKATRARTNVAGEETRVRILKCAERLFAGKGLDAVSIRDITDAAGVNTASVHYHFGSKRGLTEAILHRWAHEIGVRRARYLDQVEAMEAPTLREVVTALVMPTAELAGDRRNGGQHYVGFLATVLSHPEYMPLVVDIYEPHSARYRLALEGVTPHLTAPVRELRFAFATQFRNQVLGNRPGPVTRWMDQHTGPVDYDDLVTYVIDFTAGAFAAPDTMTPAKRDRGIKAS